MNFSLPENILRKVIPPLEEGFVEWPYRDPPLIEPFSFEIFDVSSSRKWFWTNWTLTLYISVVYVTLVQIGTRYMKSRPPFELRRALCIWNLGLAIFSAIGLARVFPELLHVVQGENGFYRSICVRDELNPSSAWWAMAFSVSKIIELFDTLFIVLRKSPLIFLHTYHHAATMVVSFFSYPQAEPIFRYVGCMNLFVHSLMYGYYLLRAMKFRPPRKVQMTITSLQLSQMFIGLGINIYAIYIKSRGIECARSEENIRVQMWIYASYFVLFLKYFYDTYLCSQSKFKDA